MKSDRMERRERSLTSVDLMGTYWTDHPQDQTHFQCDWFNWGCSRSIVLCVNDYQMIFARLRACHVCVGNMPFLVTSVSQHPVKTSVEKIQVWNLFYFCFIHLAANWKIIITKRYWYQERPDEKSQENRTTAHPCGCQLLGLESEELV